jgi:hypothetical protein
MFFYPTLKKHNFFSYKHRVLRNILKEFSAPVTVYLNSEHCELEQCNGKPALDTKSCNDSGGVVGLSFCWGAFDIEWMVREKITSTSFGGAAGHK